ncbi:GNAT family N-acetyltransferase [Sphingobacterium sp. SG20118]|uniref:GNAT family N-acetyltransferase n=1 Tax=Sphingobacterium sp. SG20118 TaxID=3367156 RepID=UPI0037DFC5A6
MKPATLQIVKLQTERLTLIPFTTEICTHILNEEFKFLDKLGLKKGRSWPDIDVIETLPKIIKNLSAVSAPTGFESWMVIKSETSEIIGDIGFKGFNKEESSADIGYGIITEERRQGYAEEAARALIKWAFSNVILNVITAKCLIENNSSIHLLKKLDFKEINKDEEMLLWSLSRTNT